MYFANSSRSTLKALPLGTSLFSVASIMIEPMIFISSLRRPHALSRDFDFKELEQTSSPKYPV